MDVVIAPVTHMNEKRSEGGGNITRVVLRGKDAVEIPVTADAGDGTRFLIRTIGKWADSLSQGEGPLGIKFVLPSSSGYILRADFFEERMADCARTELAAGFVAPLERVTPCASSGQHDGEESSVFLNQVAAAVSAATLRALSRELVLENLAALDHELENRISLPWCFPGRIARKRLALLQGGFNFEFRRRVLEGCSALGIDLYVLDKPGHWLQDESLSHLRTAFLPMDMTLDSELAKRAVQALETHGITVDGVTCFSDPHLIAAAEVASMLQLPTAPATAFSQAVDKYEFRKLLAVDGEEALRFPNLEALHRHLALGQLALSYPLIVKPTVGGGSQGVFKVDDEAGLRRAAEAIDSQGRGEFLVESYVDGPEIDANYVLIDGEIVFFEVSDNLPCAAEKPNATAADSFIESGMVYPSGLPLEEIELVCSTIYGHILRLGFRTGVFHTEARIRNSSMCYRAGEDGVIDIHERNAGSDKSCSPSVFVLEINARAPGRQATNSATRTYGVDYNAIQVLLALGEYDRARALAKPFKNGAQFWCESVYIPAPRSGMYNSDDAFLELSLRRPDLGRHIAEYHCLFEKGQMVRGPEAGTLQWILSFVVFSRSSRSEAVRLAEVIRRELRYELV